MANRICQFSRNAGMKRTVKRRMPIELRFFQYVLCGMSPGDCWVWTGGKSRQGYGQFSVDRTPQLAHRVSYSIHISASVPRALCIMHLCDNPSCVNPFHLSVGTVSDNNADRHLKGRSRGASHQGQNNPMSKLTPDDIRYIRASAQPLTVLASQYRIAFQTVSDIKRRKTWKHLA